MPAHILAVHAKATHAFSKDSVPRIHLQAGLGVAGDAHCGATVKHRSRVAKDPTQPNLRQVHFLHGELFDELARRGFQVLPGALGENITTSGLDLLNLSQDTVLRLGSRALVRITGLRNPCAQIEAWMPGLLAAVLGRTAQAERVRKAGVMGVVLESGPVGAGDAIAVHHAPPTHIGLRPV